MSFLNSRKTKWASSKWTLWIIYQLNQIFPLGIGGDQNWAKSRVNLGLQFICWPKTWLLMKTYFVVAYLNVVIAVFSTISGWECVCQLLIFSISTVFSWNSDLGGKKLNQPFQWQKPQKASWGWLQNWITPHGACIKMSNLRAELNMLTAWYEKCLWPL